MRVFVRAITTAAILMPAAAFAQSAPPPPPASSMPSLPDMPTMRADEIATEYSRFNDQVQAPNAGLPRSSRPVPVHPDDVKAGLDVRDSAGKVLGTIQSVSSGFAVIASPEGKIEIEFASLAKNNRGLLINMRKSKFDAIIASTKRPAAN